MEFSWRNAELTINWDESETFSEEAVALLEGCSPFDKHDEPIRDLSNYVDCHNCMKVTPAKANIFIADSEFIFSCRDFSTFVDYYSRKPAFTEINVACNEDNELIIKKIVIDNKNNETYMNLIEDIILDVPYIDKSKIRFSPVLFEEIYRVQNKSYQTKVRHALNFLSLLAISDRVYCVNGDYRFIIGVSPDRLEFQTNWNRENSLENDFWLDCYLWLSNKEGFVDPLHRRMIVREHVKQLNSEYWRIYDQANKYTLIKDLNSELHRVVQEKVKTHFEAKKMWRFEYINIYSKTTEISDNLLKSTISIVISLIVGISAIIFGDGDTVFYLSKNTRILSIFFTSVTAFLMVFSICTLYSFRKYKIRLKNLYENEILFHPLDNTDFPKINIGIAIAIFLFQIVVFVFCLALLVLSSRA